MQFETRNNSFGLVFLGVFPAIGTDKAMNETDERMAVATLVDLRIF